MHPCSSPGATGSAKGSAGRVGSGEGMGWGLNTAVGTVGSRPAAFGSALGWRLEAIGTLMLLPGSGAQLRDGIGFPCPG